LTDAIPICEDAQREYQAVKRFLATRPGLTDWHCSNNVKKILIIEDDKVLANVCYNQLMSVGFRVSVAPDGEAGLTLLPEFKPDIIILDLMLPQMSGTEFIKHVRALPEFARIPIIVFSNAYLTDVIQESWKAGATKFVSKSDCSRADWRKKSVKPSELWPQHHS